MAKKKSLMTIDQKQVAQSAVENIEQEIMNDHVEMVRDYIKGAYRLKFDLEKNIKRLQEQVSIIEEAVRAAKEDSDLDQVKELEIPTQYLDEKTVRLSGIDWRE